MKILLLFTVISALGLLGSRFSSAQEITPPAVTSEVANALDSVFTSEMIMELRDPFQTPDFEDLEKRAKPEIQMVQIKDMRLNGVVTGPKKTKALVSVPSGKTFFVSKGDKVGLRGGYISAIEPEAVTVVEFDTDPSGKTISELFELQLNGDVVAVSAQQSKKRDKR